MKQTTKERKESHASRERARQTSYEKMEKGSTPRNWSTTMPAYCYTVLCAALELRNYPGDKQNTK